MLAVEQEKLNMQTQKNASLFGPGHPSFQAALEWIARINSGEITSFAPIHGKIAGYHVEPSDAATPVQKFDPPIKPETEVRVTAVNEASNISIVPDTDNPGVSYFYPHVNVDVEYEAAEQSGD